MCDNCGCSFGVDSRSNSINQHRLNSRKDGWKTKGSLDYCEMCIEIMDFESNPKHTEINFKVFQSKANTKEA